VLRSLSGNRKNYAKVAQAGSTGCSFMLLHLTNAALESMQHPLTEQRESCSAVHRSFDEFELGNLALDLSI
jgi:hypothetical protein